MYGEHKYTLSESEELDNLKIKNGTCESEQYHLKIRSLVISQLIAASPASLPFNTTFYGIIRSCKDCTRDKALTSILTLIGSENVIRISECAFGDRYQLVDDCSVYLME
jgi:hypothetical protein